ncbi:hypothetical protein K505DRAFT_328021 [Melanomma pulvis-pyrius CBS 109.77]|uniref:Rhodopsin domain-containing protein n=1 Tax=Melanomma pulvis-pyrius CBS 109.77 TaxID=1314802 RepID=A0A6A6X0S2_9PLEO|nr:hypothetical protein K505DRAFT_328021 [Melanomma pulvis-pyrius CBS 109.77]
MAYDSPHGLIAAAVIVQTLVFVMIGSRFVSHRKRRLTLHTSDWLIIAAGVLSTALAIEQIYGAATGILGVPVGPLMKSNPQAVPDFLYTLRQHNYSFVVTGILAIGFIKTSVSFFYLQIFSTQNHSPFIIAWIVIMTLWTISFFTAFLAICGDHGLFSSRFFSDPKNVKKYCGNTQQVDFGLLISGTISDLVTVILPIPMIMKLNLQLSDRISIAGIFLIGLLSVGASTARTYIGIYTKFAPKDKIMDAGLGVTATCVWTLIEIQVGILAACAPTIRPVLRDVVKNGLVGSILSSARSIVSRKSSRSNISNSDSTRPEHRLKRSLSGDEKPGITASTEQVHDS